MAHTHLTNCALLVAPANRDELAYRAVACDVTSAALNQNVWQKRVTFVQEKVRFNYSVAVERRIAQTTTV